MRQPAARALAAYIQGALQFASDMGGVENAYEAMRQLVLQFREQAKILAAQANDPRTSETAPANPEPSMILSPLSHQEELILPGYE